MTGETVPVTSSVDTFLGALHDGDVLLFDNLHAVSNVIKLADNSPVSHCAVYQRDGEQIIHAGPPPAGAFAVRRESLRNRLDDRLTRTVTALRHGDPKLGAAVLLEAERWLKKDSHYAFKSLLDLAASCFNRSYGRPLADAEMKSHERLLRRISLLMSTLTAFVVDDESGVWSLTCSEFVYSCHIATDPTSIVIEDPLSFWGEKGRSKVYVDDPGRRPGGPQPFTRIAPEAHSDDDDDRKILFPNPDGVATPPPSAPTPGDSAADTLQTERYELDEERRSDQLRGKPVFRARGDEPPYAPAVTPFDLWQSRSFTAVNVLHRPPTHDDPVRLRRGTDRRDRPPNAPSRPRGAE